VTIYEVFTWPWLERLGPGVTLADVPEGAWDALALPGVDTVWLMGVWERSPVGREIARTHPDLAFAPPEDVIGSPYCIRSYTVDPRLGGREGLAASREALARRGLKLLLDFVPNHVARDHAWAARPEFVVPGDRSEQDGWIETPEGAVALGRDPYFPPWTDVVQLDPMSAPLRDAVVETLFDIAEQCDGVRCDMAMLMLDDVAERTWGGRLQPRRPEPYWRAVTRGVKAERPDFVFLAEAYWDRECDLFDQGIDYCYDKRLYDRLLGGDAASLRAHLGADPTWQARLVRFIENHDEPRATDVFPPRRLRAAAVALMTLPGALLLHEEQLTGPRLRLPVQLGRRPVEPVDEELTAFWHDLLATAQRVRVGAWQLLDVTGWPDNQSCERLLAWRWRDHIVVINFSDERADGLVAGEAYVALDPWQSEIRPLAVAPSPNPVFSY